MKKALVIIILTFICHSLIVGQTNNPKGKIVGKWSMCQSFKFDNNYKCDSILKYEFFDDGTYKENRKTVCNSQHYNDVPGHWEIKSNRLTIAEDEYCSGLKRWKAVHKIKWLSNDMFYMEGREGKNGPKVYTYYMRIN